MDPTGSDDEIAGSSPSMAARIRSHTRSLISDANRVGLKAFSAQLTSKVDGTPARAITTLDFPQGRGLNVEGATLIEELGPVLDADSSFIQKQFKKLRNNVVVEFLEEVSGVWDKKTNRRVGGVWDPEARRWRLPRKAALEKDIYPLMLKIIAAIIAKFHKCPPGVEREVLDTHNVRFYHKDSNYTSPDLVVRACGRSFSKPERGDVGYSSTATFFDVKRECDMGNRDTHIKQFGTYVRYVE